MSFLKKVGKDAAKQAGTLAGSAMSKNYQDATDATVHGMDLFRQVALKKANVAFDQAKGNLFEYIEAAKFNKDAALKGKPLRAVVTDSVGRPHDPADIEIVTGGEVVRQVQAKFSDSKHAAADSVAMQKSDKYKGMQRLIRKDDSYIDSSTGERTTLLKRAKNLAKDRASRQGNIYQEQYQDVVENITDELNHDGITSGGTTLEEVQFAYDSPEKYARSVEHKQFAAEMKYTAKNMAAASMVTSGIMSGVLHMFSVFKDEEELSKALADVGADVAKAGVRGAATGIISTRIRFKGVKTGNALLSDATAATVMAGGIIDGGVALYSYAKGDISAEQLRDELVDTTAKAASTIYFTKAITAIMGTGVCPFIPMAAYTTASYVISCTREIIKNAELNAEEYNRMAALLQESTRTVNKTHEELKKYVALCESQQRAMLDGFIDSFEYDIATGENYDRAVHAIVSFANQAGIALQHVSFDEFKTAMRSQDTFILG